MARIARTWRILQPLRSRKVRVALATVIAAWAAQYGLQVSEQVVFTIIGVGASLILGIALEDAGAKSAHAMKPTDNHT